MIIPREEIGTTGVRVGSSASVELSWHVGFTPDSGRLAAMQLRTLRAISRSREDVAAALRFQAIEQHLRLLQIARLKPFRKPPVDRSQQFARFLHLALVAPEACEAYCGAQFV
jgi:hypothetical protein